MHLHTRQAHASNNADVYIEQKSLGDEEGKKDNKQAAGKKRPGPGGRSAAALYSLSVAVESALAYQLLQYLTFRERDTFHTAKRAKGKAHMVDRMLTRNQI